nr:GDSL esterase/lipase At3g48460-like [Tanacetum cinerariifolium]
MSPTRLEGYGRTFFHHPTNRYSDGRLVIDYVAEYLNLPYFPPYRNKSADTTHGVNFAVGGCTVIPYSYFLKINATFDTVPESLVPTQLEWFKDHIKGSGCKDAISTPKECKKVFDGALVWIGEMSANDYNYLFRTKATSKSIQKLAICGGDYNFNMMATCGSSEANSCKHPSRYMNWDGLHVTSELSRVVSKMFLDGGFAHPTFPYLLKKAAESGLCATYEVDNYTRIPSTEHSKSASTPLTPEELKTAKEAWGILFDIVKDNKRYRTNALKAELRSIKLGDRSMESYFQKVDSIVNILTSFDARVNKEDVVHCVLDGLPETYNQVCGYMHYRDTFPDLKTVRSLLITEEMRLKSKSLSLPVDSSSSSLVVLMAQSGVNRRPTTSQSKSSRPCFNFVKGSCRFGNECRYVHDLGINSNIATIAPVPTVMPCANVAYHTPSPDPVQQYQLAQYYTSLPVMGVPPQAHYSAIGPPPGFPAEPFSPNTSIVGQAQLPSQPTGPATALPAYPALSPTTPPQQLSTLGTLGQATVLHHAFTAEKLIYVRRNNCTIEFDAFGFSVKDYTTRQVMAISIILVLSDSSEKRVGTSTGRVILFGTIPTTIPDTTLSMTLPSTHIDTTPIPIVSSTIPPSPDYTPASPDYTPASPYYSPSSDTESDPSEDPSLDHIPPLPATSPFLSSSDGSLDNGVPDTPPSPTHGTPFTETTLSTQRSPALSGPVHMMTTRKRVGSLPTHRLAVRHSVDFSSSDHFTSDDSLRDSSSSSSSETSSDPSSDDLSDSSSDHSLPAPSSGMRPSHHLCSLVPSIPRSSIVIIDRPSQYSSSVSPSRKRSRSPAASVSLSSPIPKS